MGSVTRRRAALGALSAAAFAGGALAGAGHRGAEERLAERFAGAWERADYATMHSLLSDRARRRTPLLAFAAAQREALATATAIELDAGRPEAPRGGEIALPVRVRTRVFGTVAGTVRLAIEGEGEGARIAWSPNLVFPGLRLGERLTRRTRLPPRAAILARDGTPLAAGPERSSPLGAGAAEIRGALGPPPLERSTALRSAGVPDDALVGLSGLERVLDARLLGRPGGELLAGVRVLARSSPRAARPVRTTIDPRVQQAVTAALAGRLGGIAVLRPRNGEILGLAGIAFSGLQPPGSTFKIVTVAAALDARLVRPSTPFPARTAAVLEGVELENANGELCGGTLARAFAHSCNSVFAPLGVRIGAQRLVATAERFGFNEAPGVPGAATSTIPAAEEIGDDLALGSTAIGQGRVQATALQMAVIAATIARRGRRPRPVLLPADRPRLTRALSPRVARIVARLMRGVVRFGTGTAAAIPGVPVAGKTGTAELKDTSEDCKPDPGQPKACPPKRVSDPTDTDAWFAAYAPADRPRVAVGVLLVGAGAGGDTAAPVAREVMLAALRARR